MRSGTANVPNTVGLAWALRLCLEEMDTERQRLFELRRRLYEGLASNIDGVTLNGPALEPRDLRLEGNLNCQFDGVEGEALMMSMRELAVSSGSACTSADPAPSHVLRAIGLTEHEARSSLRFGLGRFNIEEEVDFAIETVTAAVTRLRKLLG
jgi:cysteine desulfurase